MRKLKKNWLLSLIVAVLPLTVTLEGQAGVVDTMKSGAKKIGSEAANFGKEVGGEVLSATKKKARDAALKKLGVVDGEQGPVATEDFDPNKACVKSRCTKMPSLVGLCKAAKADGRLTKSNPSKYCLLDSEALAKDKKAKTVKKSKKDKTAKKDKKSKKGKESK